MRIFQRAIEFLLKPWSGDQSFYINLRGEDENFIKHNYPSLTEFVSNADSFNMKQIVLRIKPYFLDK